MLILGQMGRVGSSLSSLRLLNQALVDKASYAGRQRICKVELKRTIHWIVMLKLVVATSYPSFLLFTPSAPSQYKAEKIYFKKGSHFY